MFCFIVVHFSGGSEGLSTNGTLCNPSSSSQGDITNEPSDSQVLVNVSTAIKPVGSRVRPGSSSNHVSADSALNQSGLSPSSSSGSLSSEKSTLNLNAKVNSWQKPDNFPPFKSLWFLTFD